MFSVTKLLCAGTLALLSTLCSVAQGTVLYQYTSTPYDQDGTGPQGFLGKQMTVNLTFANVLPANVTQSVCPSGCAATVLDFNVNGGLPGFEATKANGAVMLSGSLTTNAAGNIVDWSMTFLRLSFALVTTSTSNKEADLALPTYDHGEILNTHWGTTTRSAWTVQSNAVDTPGTLSLLAVLLIAAMRRTRPA